MTHNIKTMSCLQLFHRNTSFYCKGHQLYFLIRCISHSLKSSLFFVYLLSIDRKGIGFFLANSLHQSSIGLRALIVHKFNFKEARQHIQSFNHSSDIHLTLTHSCLQPLNHLTILVISQTKAIQSPAWGTTSTRRPPFHFPLSNILV